MLEFEAVVNDAVEVPRRVKHRSRTQRVDDLEKLLEGSRNDAVNAFKQLSVINVLNLETIFRGLDSVRRLSQSLIAQDTKALVDARTSEDRFNKSLDIVNVVVAASFFYSVVDRVINNGVRVDAACSLMEATSSSSPTTTSAKRTTPS
jgi:hypothetical protein